MAEHNINEYAQDGAHAVKKKRKGSIIAFIICVLIAFAIWVYARNAEIMEESEQPMPPVGDQQVSAEHSEG